MLIKRRTIARNMNSVQSSPSHRPTSLNRSLQMAIKVDTIKCLNSFRKMVSKSTRFKRRKGRSLKSRCSRSLCWPIKLIRRQRKEQWKTTLKILRSRRQLIINHTINQNSKKCRFWSSNKWYRKKSFNRKFQEWNKIKLLQMIATNQKKKGLRLGRQGKEMVDNSKWLILMVYRMIAILVSVKASNKEIENQRIVSWNNLNFQRGKKACFWITQPWMFKDLLKNFTPKDFLQQLLNQVTSIWHQRHLVK
jgi:hypothetical protein